MNDYVSGDGGATVASGGAGISQAPASCGRETHGTQGENRLAAPDARKVWVSG